MRGFSLKIGNPEISEKNNFFEKNDFNTQFYDKPKLGIVSLGLKGVSNKI